MMIGFRHNMEVAHRLLNLPGKCQQIHGHSMKVHLKLYPEVNEDGYAINSEGRILDFGWCKKRFREYIDTIYDHQLLLSKDDPWAGAVTVDGDRAEELPGLRRVQADPSTENIALWISWWAYDEFKCHVDVEIWETETNFVGVGA